MYTRAKKNGRKVMAGGENRMMQPARGPMWSSKSKNQASPNERLGFDRRSNKKVAAGMGCHLRYMYSGDVSLQIGQPKALS